MDKRPLQLKESQVLYSNEMTMLQAKNYVWRMDIAIQPKNNQHVIKTVNLCAVDMVDEPAILTRLIVFVRKWWEVKAMMAKQ